MSVSYELNPAMDCYVPDANSENDDERIAGSEHEQLAFLGFYDLTSDDSAQESAAPAGAGQSRRRVPRSSNPSGDGWREIQSLEFGQSKLKPGKCVELLTYSGNEHRRPQFLAIRRIHENMQTQQKLLLGVPLYRNSSVGGIFAPKLNEVFMEIDIDVDDERPIYEQGSINVRFEDVVKIRIIKFTHEKFPALSFRGDTFLSSIQMDEETYERQRRIVKDTCVLVCRYIKINRPAKAEHGRVQAWRSQVEVRALYDQEHPNQLLSARLKRSEPRPVGLSQPIKNVKHTYGSGFCGCGGDSMGAELAGFDVVFGWDREAKAIATYEKNHPRATTFVQDAWNMIGMDDEFIPHADVCHLSCPCKFWSQINTHPDGGRNGEENRNTVFTIKPWLMKKKPTIMTLEQVTGIVRLERHKAWFQLVINEIISAGYNVRWSQFEFSEYGLASSRPRMVIFAARIGHPLPEFPARTHGPGLLPPYHIEDALKTVPREAEWHLDEVNNFAQSKVAYDPKRHAHCLMTNHGNDKPGAYHPSGLRPFSIRERAALAGFPPNFQFPKKDEVVGDNPRNKITKDDLLTQTGDVVPPLVWAKFMKMVSKCLSDFRDGKIDEDGKPVLLRETGNGVASAARRMRGMSLEPKRDSVAQAIAHRKHEFSAILNPDPPERQLSTSFRPAVEVVDLSDLDQEQAPPRMKRSYIDLDE